MIHGAMQPFSLTLDKFLDHAARWSGSAKIVTARGDGQIEESGYAALKARSGRASAILASLDVTRGDHVATLAWNTQAHLEIWYAVMGMGAVCHTLNLRLTVDELTSMIDQSGARVLIASVDQSGLADRIAERAGHEVRVLTIDDPVDGRALEPLIETTAKPLAWGGFDEDAPCGLCFTSGTTGAPKGVTYTHRSNYLHTLSALGVDSLAISRADTVLMAVPMFHANAWGLPFIAPAAGASLVLPGRHLDGASLRRLIRDHAVTVAAGVPTVWLGLLEHMDREGGGLPSLKRIVLGGAPTPPSLMARLQARLGVIVQNTWGMTELSPVGTVASTAVGDRQAVRSGRPAIGVDLMLADEQGHPLPDQRAAEGHLHVRGPAVIERYFDQAQSATNGEGWFATGDLARIDDDGELRITGRAKELIKSGGEWINPAQIEAIVNALPEVAMAAVIARADPKWGERPILIVEMRDKDVGDETLLAALKGKVASWWIPDAVIRLARMPVAGTGKIDKKRLRRDHAASAAQPV